MKFVRWFSLGVGVLVLSLVAITAFLPKEYDIQRSIEIDAPAPIIYSQVSDLEEWQNWNPWNEMDPDITITYGNIRSGAGANYSWVGEAAGSGNMLITAVEPPNRVDYELVFEGWEENPSSSSFIIEPLESGGNKVTWTFVGDVEGKYFSRWLVLMMDKMVGQNYDHGLSSLKERSEDLANQLESIK